MFEDINSIDWSALTTCYGPATEVPGWLCDAMSNDVQAHASAFRNLHDALYHQGDRFPASAVAIPFLMHIALDPHAIHRGTALEIVAHLVGGPCSFRDGFWLSDGEHTVLGSFEIPSGAADDARSDIWRACHDTARGYVVSLLHLAEMGPDDVRRMASYVLATLGAERSALVPRLQVMFARERVDEVRAAQVFALGMAAPRCVDEFLLKVVETDRSFLVRLVAAMVFGWTGQHIPDPVMDQLLEGLCASSGGPGTEIGGFPPAIGDLGTEYARLPFGGDGLAGDLGHVLARLEGPYATHRALYPLFRALKSSDGVTLLGVVRGILRVGLRESTRSDADARRARAAKSALFYADAVWRLPQATALLEMCGLPSNRDEFGNSIGLSLKSHAEGQRALNAGIALGRADRVEEALEQFRQAAALRSHDLLSVLNMIWGLWALQRNSEGLVEVELALAVFAQSVDLHFYHAHFLLADGQCAAAKDACSRGLAIQDSASLLYTRACAHARLQEPEQAMGDLRRCLARDPGYAKDIVTNEDFASLRGLKDFRYLVSPHSTM